MAEINVIEFAYAKDFLSALRLSNDLWWDDEKVATSHYFRGHANAEWPLLAKRLFGKSARWGSV